MIRAWNTRSGDWQMSPAQWIGHPDWGADFVIEKPADATAPEEGSKPARRAEKKEGK